MDGARTPTTCRCKKQTVGKKKTATRTGNRERLLIKEKFGQALQGKGRKGEKKTNSGQVKLGDIRRNCIGSKLILGGGGQKPGARGGFSRKKKGIFSTGELVVLD